MTATALLEELAHRGISVTRKGDRLHYRAQKGALTEELKRLIVAHKPELLMALPYPGPNPAGCFACGSTRRWRRLPEPRWACARCHPPGVPEGVEWIGE